MKLWNFSKKALKTIAFPFKEYIINGEFRIRTRYGRYYNKNAIKENVILYESYHGKNISCNPYAIFKELITDPEFKNFIHVWAVNNNDPEILQPIKRYTNVRVVKKNSKKYLYYLTTAKYLINNVTFPYYFQKKPGQVYINTWHGTPMKTLGKDIKNAGISDHSNVQRNFLHADYLVVPNKFTLDKITKSYDIDGIYDKFVLEVGYPRIDLMYKANREEIRKILNIPENKKVILYAPTWRGETAYREKDNSQIIYEDYRKIKNSLPDDYILLLKAHSLTYKFFKENGLEKYCVPFWIDTNELLSIVDILITDYSSIWFDFLPSQRPILFYVYDKEQYESERGFYLSFDELPGPICRSIDELIENIKNIESIKKCFAQSLNQSLLKYCYSDDGNASRRVIDIVFRQKHENYSVYTINNNKKRLLFYCGGFITNGITTAAINLLNKIDLEKYDVTVLFGGKLDDITKRNLAKVRREIRFVYRKGTYNFRFIDFYRHKLLIYFGLNKQWARKWLLAPKIYENEFNRIFGETKFDVGIDFSGYSEMWALLIAFGNFRKRYIYLHNNMVADSNRKVNGKYLFKRNFNIIFNIYDKFDKLISVSSDSMEINKENLKRYNVSDKIVCVYNVVDFQRVIDGSSAGKCVQFENKKYLLLEGTQINGLTYFKGIRLPSKDEISFVTIGRLSPEKDHKKLIRAFHKVYQLHKNVKLYIVGEGPLKAELIELINNYKLRDRVILTGLLDNPFPLVKACDCFVLSSNYEGQPLVLLEALALNKPIISTNISGVKSVLEGGYAELVENSEEGLTIGMIKFINNEIKLKQYDCERHNEIAMDMFYKEVCSD